MTGFTPRVLIVCALACAAATTASSQFVSPRSQPVPTTYPFKLGYIFKCPFLGPDNPDLEPPLACSATEYLNYRGQPAALLAVPWGRISYGDTVGDKDYAFFIAKPDGTFERMDALRDLSSWPGSRGHPSRYAFFTRSVGAQQFWRNNLGAERMFASELTVDNGRPCIESHLQAPYNGTITQCAGADPEGVIGENPGVMSLKEAIDVARPALERQLPPRTLVTKPFPSVFSEHYPIGNPSTFVTYQTPDVGQSYWAMTYSGASGHYLIRVFPDRRVEIEMATPADAQKWDAETVR